MKQVWDNNIYNFVGEMTLCFSSYVEGEKNNESSIFPDFRRKELDSLGKVKQGWKRASTANVGPNSKLADINRQSQIKVEQQVAVKHGINRIPKVSPKTQSEFERDWHRCPSLNDKLVYLRRVTPDRVREGLFKVGLDPQLLASVLSTLSNAYDWSGEELSSWLDALSNTGRFDLSLRFMDQEEKRCLEELMERAEADSRLKKRYSIE